MSFKTGYKPTHKVVDEISRITPNVEHSESHRPHVEFRIASWVPVSRWDESKKTWISISLGKVVATDRLGRIVPAGLKKRFNAAAGTNVLSYTVNDVASKVMDLVTGAPVASAVTYTEAQVTDALRKAGLVAHTERAVDFVSKPIGIAPYNMYDASGDDPHNPTTWKYHNWNPQANVAVLCDYAITVPHFPAKATTETMANAISNTAGALDWSTEVRAGGWFGAAVLAGIPKYASSIVAGDDVVAYCLANHPVAKITAATPVSASVAGLLKHVGSVEEISSAGDFFLDEELGLLFLFEDGGDAIPAPWAVTSTLTYFHYRTAVGGTDSRLQSFVVATGDLKIGDFLTYDSASNLVKAVLDIGTAEGYDADGAPFTADPDYAAGAATAVSGQIEKAVTGWMTGIVGQVIGEERFPKAYLDRVRTLFNDSTDPLMQAPGSATGGRTDQLSYSHSADRMLIVNLILR